MRCRDGEEEQGGGTKKDVGQRSLYPIQVRQEISKSSEAKCAHTWGDGLVDNIPFFSCHTLWISRSILHYICIFIYRVANVILKRKIQVGYFYFALFFETII